MANETSQPTDLRERISQVASPSLAKLVVEIATGDTEGHSVQFWFEECLRRGINAVDNQRAQARKRLAQERKALGIDKFNADLVANPQIALDPRALLALMKKHGIDVPNIVTSAQGAGAAGANQPTAKPNAA